MPTKIKNATSTTTRTFDIIQKTLADHGVRQITYDYDGKGKITAIAFCIEIGGDLYPFRLPARVEKVEHLMYSRYATPAQKEQAYRTAWANIRDWIAAQLALIDTGMVTAEEIFLPYMIGNRGNTFYEEMSESHFLLPEYRQKDQE